MTRLWIALIIALVAGSLLAWLADMPGSVILAWRDLRIDFSFAAVALLLAVLALFIAVMARFWGWLRRKMPLLGSERWMRRRQRGWHNLLRAHDALARGDRNGARGLAEKAGHLLRDEALGQYLAGKIMLGAGKRNEARAYFSTVATERFGRAAALRELAVLALAGDETGEAESLALKAADGTRNGWAQDFLFRLYAHEGRWDEALDRLERARKADALSDEAANRYRAGLLYGEAREAHLAGERDEALRKIRRAIGYLPAFPEAWLLQVRAEIAAGKPGAARKTLRKAWDAAKHPGILDAFDGLEKRETPAEKYRRFKNFLGEVKSYEGLLRQARQAWEADEKAEARDLLERALRLRRGRRAVRLALRFERETAMPGSHQIGKLERELETAGDAAAYVCGACGNAVLDWTLHCRACGELMGLVWQDMPEAAARSPRQAKPTMILSPAPDMRDRKKDADQET